MHVIVNAKVSGAHAVSMRTMLTYILVDLGILIIMLSVITYTTSTPYLLTHENEDYSSYTQYHNHLIKGVSSSNHNQQTVEYFCAAPEDGSVAFYTEVFVLLINAGYVLLSVYYLVLTRDLPSTILAAGNAGSGERN